MDCKTKQHVCIKFCVKLGKSATETLEMLHEAFGEHSLNWTAMAFTFQGQLSVNWKMTNVQGDKAPATR
jgi:hypothetical protein